MPQWVVIAYDGADALALERRMSVREAHLRNVAPMVEKGELLLGGAILDDAGKMAGSVAIVDFPDQAALDAWLNNDPYVTGKVWQKIEVKPFRTAVMAAKK
jgi:uncharacterized protein YciI